MPTLDDETLSKWNSILNCACALVCMCASMHTNMRTRARTHIDARIRASMPTVWAPHACLCTHEHPCRRTRTHVHVRSTHACMQKHRLTRACTHTHTHTLKHKLSHNTNTYHIQHSMFLAIDYLCRILCIIKTHQRFKGPLLH